jgi:hypothetical protein
MQNPDSQKSMAGSSSFSGGERRNELVARPAETDLVDTGA